MIHVEYDITEDQSWVVVDGEKIGPFSVKEGNNIDSLIKGLQYQLHSARYAFHKVVKARYAEKGKLGRDRDVYGPEVAVVNYRVPLGTEAECYAQAMANYDGIIKEAVTGACREANQAEMDKGFE